MAQEWINLIVGLVTGLAGLISAGVTAYFAIKNFVKSLKDKNKTELWNMAMSLADAAMKEAEASGKAGADKKEMVINAVKAGLADAGLEIGEFLDQLNSYIDQTISFVNTMKDLKK